MPKYSNTERRWTVPNRRAKSYAEERKAKDHNKSKYTRSFIFCFYF